MEYKEIMTIFRADEDDFTKQINELLKRGWVILSTSCGFVNSEAYDFQGCYQAIVSLPDNCLSAIQGDNKETEKLEQLTEHNTNVVSEFMQHCKDEGYDLPDHLFESFFNA